MSGPTLSVFVACTQAGQGWVRTTLVERLTKEIVSSLNPGEVGHGLADVDSLWAGGEASGLGTRQVTVEPSVFAFPGGFRPW